MDRLVSVRESVHIGCAGDEPTTPLGRGGESPSFTIFLTSRQVDELAVFRMQHGFYLHSDPACTEILAVPTWSADLSTVEELHVSCSCGYFCTFDQAGEEVKHG